MMMLARNGELGGGLPARQQLPTTEPTPFQVSNHFNPSIHPHFYHNYLSISSFQLEGSKRLEERAAAWQAEVLRWASIFSLGLNIKLRLYGGLMIWNKCKVAAILGSN